MQNLFSCQKCGTQNRIGDRSCKKCGMGFQYYCPQCRSPVNGGDAVCGRCGNVLDWPSANPNEKGTEPNREPPKGKKGSWVGPVIGILVALLLGVSGYYAFIVLSEQQNTNTTTENLTTGGDKTELVYPDTASPTISDIQVNKMSGNSIVISWVTDELSTSQVIWNAKNNSSNTTRHKEALVKDHSVELSDLKDKTTYYFKVRSIDQWGNEALPGQQTFDMGEKTGISSIEVKSHSMSIEEKPPISGVRTYISGEIRNTGEIPIDIKDIQVTVTITIRGNAGKSDILATLDPYPYEVNPGGTHKFYAIVPNNSNPDYTVSARVLQ